MKTPLTPLTPLTPPTPLPTPASRPIDLRFIFTWIIALPLAGCVSPSERDAASVEPAAPCCATETPDSPLVPTGVAMGRIFPDGELPNVPLVDQTGRRTSFAAVIEGDTPVALDFIFTTCTTICPVMTATFSRLHEELGDSGDDLRLVSISLDPEYDTPEVLRTYAKKFKGDPRWTFLTGDAERLTELYRRYEVLTGTNKMTHLPFVLFRFPGETSWIRVEGLRGAADLAAEFRAAVEARTAGKASQ